MNTWKDVSLNSSRQGLNCASNGIQTVAARISDDVWEFQNLVSGYPQGQEPVSLTNDDIEALDTVRMLMSELSQG